MTVAPASEPGEWLTTSQAARVAQVSADSIRVWARTGRLPCARTPLGALIRREDVERLAAARELGPARSRVRTRQVRPARL